MRAYASSNCPRDHWLDVLVHLEEVRWVVLVLQGDL